MRDEDPAPQPDDGGDEEAREHDLDHLPEGFEHFRFRARPEIAEALRKMTLPPGEPPS